MGRILDFEVGMKDSDLRVVQDFVQAVKAKVAQEFAETLLQEIWCGCDCDGDAVRVLIKETANKFGAKFSVADEAVDRSLQLSREESVAVADLIRAWCKVEDELCEARYEVPAVGAYYKRKISEGLVSLGYRLQSKAVEGLAKALFAKLSVDGEYRGKEVIEAIKFAAKELGVNLS